MLNRPHRWTLNTERRRSTLAFSCLLLWLFTPTQPHAQTAQTVIVSVDVDYTSWEMSISGVNFDNGSPPVVRLAQQTMPLVGYNATTIQVSIPASLRAPASHVLTVSAGSSADQIDSFNLTLGAEGPRGLPGQKGDKGDKGDIGPVGLPGPKGDKGDIGPPGLTGSPGPQGGKGDKGDIGPVGQQGPKGDKGDVGPVGSVGPQGSKGEKGDIGPIGLTGPQGERGDKGETGPTGAAGTPGRDGTSGQEGPATLVATLAEEVGGNCAAGGTKIEIGQDTNRNGILDSTEITAALTRYVCNGTQGPIGPQGLAGAPGVQGQEGKPGQQGQEGKPGQQGQPGLEGLATLVKTSPKTAGRDCATGGTMVEVGIDKNRDGILDNAEVIPTQTRIICNGIQGQPGLSSLARATAMPSSSLCPTGGAKVEVGIDRNQNGRLDDAEVNPLQSSQVCHGNPGQTGSPGLSPVVKTTTVQPSTTCTEGGIKVEVGLDGNRNGVLDPLEIDWRQSRNVCNGLRGPQGNTGAQGPRGPVGAFFTQNLDGTCRYANPFTGGCWCPAGFWPSRSLEFVGSYTGQGAYCDGFRRVCGIIQYMCIPY